MALLACAGLQAATISTTITVNATATLSGTNFALSGTTNMTGGIGTGKISSTLSLTSIAGGGTSASADYTITVDSGGTLTGKLAVPISVLTGGTGAVSVTLTVTGGTGTYSGATSGSSPITLSGNVSGDLITGFKFNNFTGSGTITTGGGGSGGPTTPTITTVQNNYGNVRPGLPNYAIAPSALFYIQGSNLANTTTQLLSSAAPGLQTTVSNVSVTVTSGGFTQQCPLYYLSPTQIDAVLPGNTPTGSATITVTNNGATSAAFSITVAQSAFGILSYNGSLAATYDANNNIIVSNNSANPGQPIVLWGSGVGADPADDDKLFPQKQDNLTNIPMQVFVGGISADIAYRGRSQFPGVDQIVITVPNNAPTGCYVSLVVVSGSIVSNSTTIPIAATGKTCSDPNSGITPDIIATLSGKTTIKQGFLTISQSTNVGASGSQTTNTVGGLFASVSGFAGSSAANQASIGSCIVTVAQASSGGVGSFTGLDAGATIGVTGPGGSLNLTPISAPGFSSLGFYSTSNGTVPAGFLPATGGTFTFDNGGGGKDVGHFNTTVNMPQQFTWTNASSVTSVNRSQGATVTWSGGTPGTFVQISGSSTANTVSGNYTVSFVCNAPIAANQFAIPTPVLLSLPASTNGSLSVGDNTNIGFFTASGLDLGLTVGSSTTSRTVTYQ